MAKNVAQTCPAPQRSPAPIVPGETAALTDTGGPQPEAAQPAKRRPGRRGEPKCNRYGFFYLRIIIGGRREVFSLGTKKKEEAHRRHAELEKLRDQGADAERLRAAIAEWRPNPEVRRLVKAQIEKFTLPGERTIGEFVAEFRAFQLPGYAKSISAQAKADFAYGMRQMGATVVQVRLGLSNQQLAELPPEVLDLVPVRLLTRDIVSEHSARLVGKHRFEERDRLSARAAKHLASIKGAFTSNFRVHLQKLGYQFLPSFEKFLTTTLRAKPLPKFRPVARETLARITALAKEFVHSGKGLAAAHIISRLEYGMPLADLPGVEECWDLKKCEVRIGCARLPGNRGSFALLRYHAVLHRPGRTEDKDARKLVADKLREEFPEHTHWQEKPLESIAMLGRDRLFALPGGYRRRGYRESDLIRAFGRGADWLIQFHGLDGGRRVWSSISERHLTRLGKFIKNFSHEEKKAA